MLSPRQIQDHPLLSSTLVFSIPINLVFFFSHTNYLCCIFGQFGFLDSFLATSCQEEGVGYHLYETWGKIQSCKSRYPARVLILFTMNLGALDPLFSGMEERMVHLALDGMGKGQV